MAQQTPNSFQSVGVVPQAWEDQAGTVPAIVQGKAMTEPASPERMTNNFVDDRNDYVGERRNEPNFWKKKTFETGPVVWTPQRILLALVSVAVVGGIIAALLYYYPLNDENSGANNANTGGTSGSSFVAGTKVKMADGTWTNIELLSLGDEVALGGRIMARMEFEASFDDLFLYPAETKAEAHSTSGAPDHTSYIIVAGGHAVYEHGLWRRVRDAPSAKPIAADEFDSLPRPVGLSKKHPPRLFDVDVEKHRLVIRPQVSGKEELLGVIFSDFSEVDHDHPKIVEFEKSLLNTLQSTSSLIEL